MVLSAPLVVSADDILVIPEGAKIKVEVNGYIYSKGSIFIGINNPTYTQGTSSTSTMSAKKVVIESYNDQFFIQCLS